MADRTCQDSELLKARLRADTKVYGDSVARLILASGDVSTTEYKRAKVAERALQSAKKRLHQHIAEHRCESLERG